MKKLLKRYGSITMIAAGICAIALLLASGASRISLAVTDLERLVVRAQETESIAAQLAGLAAMLDATFAEQYVAMLHDDARVLSHHAQRLGAIRSAIELLEHTARAQPHFRPTIQFVVGPIRTELERLTAASRSAAAGDEARPKAFASHGPINEDVTARLHAAEQDLHDDLLALYVQRSEARDRIRNTTAWTAMSIALILAAMAATALAELVLLKRLSAKLLREARYDELTGVANRKQFDEELARTIAHARRHGTKVGLLYLDLNDFKAVNDTLGHRAGDDVLRQAARSLQSRTRAGDLFARLGGDEFAVLVTDVDGRDDLESAAQRYRELSVEKAGLLVTTSVGHALLPDDGLNAESMVSASDRRMYANKALLKSKVASAHTAPPRAA